MESKHVRNYEDQSVVEEYEHDKDLHPPELERVDKWIEGIMSARLLDIGVGGGRTTATLGKLCYEYTGIDASENMVSSCRRQYPDLRFVRCDARDLSPFATDTFDFVLFSFNGIDTVSIDGRDAVLQEIARVVRPKGMFAFSTHSLRAMNHRIQWSLGNSFRRPPTGMAATALWKVGVYCRNVKKGLWSAANRRFEVTTPNYAVVNDPYASERGCGFMTMFVDIQWQRETLGHFGFQVVCVLDEDGKTVAIDDAGESCLMYHFVCEKAVDPISKHQ